MCMPCVVWPQATNWQDTGLPLRRAGRVILFSWVSPSRSAREEGSPQAGDISVNSSMASTLPSTGTVDLAVRR